MTEPPIKGFWLYSNQFEFKLNPKIYEISLSQDIAGHAGNQKGGAEFVEARADF